MCKVIAICNQKGGVGKTVTKVNLVIDLQCRATAIIACSNATACDNSLACTDSQADIVVKK